MIFTFYSFKGGVGRSMAMAATAYLFAQRGLRVLAIDFDLEAPGLERYFFDDASRQLDRVRGGAGVIDLVLAYKRALTSPQAFEAADFKNWSNFVVTAIPMTAKKGSVDLMTAGRRFPDAQYAQYALSVRNFDWQDFFNNWRGDRFFDWLRADLIGADPRYDVVLVDSRTGVTEMGGVCAYQLADAAVLLCAPNYQNLDGTRAVVDDFKSDAVLALRGGRPLDLLVVPARVDQDDTRLAADREQFFQKFQERFGADGLPKPLADVGLTYRRLTVAYHPDLAIIERLVDSEALARQSFETLADALTLLATGERFLALRDEAVARLSGTPLRHAVPTVADVTRRGAGYDVVLYAGPDEADAARDLHQRMSDRGLAVLLLDESRLADLERVRETILPYARSFAVCMGQSSGGQTYRTLLRDVEQRRLPVFPLLVGSTSESGSTIAAQHGFADVLWFDLRKGGVDAAIERIAMRLSEETRSAVRADATPAVNPYPGREPFSEDLAPFFAGRRTEVEALAAALQMHDVVLLHGATSVGKTSLVRAGLFAVVRQWGTRPFADGALQEWAIREWDATTAVPEGLAGDLAKRTLVVIDHADTFHRDGSNAGWPQRRDLIGDLLSARRESAKVLIVWRGTLTDADRADTLAHWEHRARTSIVPVNVPPLSEALLREALEHPADEVGHLFEPGLLDRLAADAGAGPGAIAQAQIVMADLWTARRQGWLTNKAYDTQGGVAGRFASRLERYLARQDAETGHAAKALLLRLVRFDTELRVVAETRPCADVLSMPIVAGANAAGLRDELVAERIIDVWLEPTGSLLLCALAQATVPLVLQDAARADVEFFLWRQRLASHVHVFADPAGGAAPVIAGDILDEAERWASTWSAQLAAIESNLIERSIRAREAEAEAASRRANELARAEADGERARQEAEQARRRTLLARRLAGVIGILTLVAIGAAVYAGAQWRRAREAELSERSGRQSAEVAATAQTIRSAAPDNLDLSALLAIEALRMAPNPSADEELRMAVRLLGQPLVRLDHDVPLEYVAFGPDGHVVALPRGSEAVVWNWETGTIVQRHAHGSRISTIAVSADRAMTATAAGAEVHVWSTISGAEVARLTHSAAVNAIAFSPDGRYVATGCDDGAVTLWRLVGSLAVALRLHQAGVHVVAFASTANEVLLASAGDDGWARAWRLPDLSPVGAAQHRGAVTFVGLVPDPQSQGAQRLIVTGGFERELRFSPLSGANNARPVRRQPGGRTIPGNDDTIGLLSLLMSGVDADLANLNVRASSSRLPAGVDPRLLPSPMPSMPTADTSRSTLVAMSSTGFLTMGSGRSARLWASTGNWLESSRLLHDGPVVGAEVRDDLAVAAARGGTIRVWRMNDRRRWQYSDDGRWRFRWVDSDEMAWQESPFTAPERGPIRALRTDDYFFFGSDSLVLINPEQIHTIHLRNGTSATRNLGAQIRTAVVGGDNVLVVGTNDVALHALTKGERTWSAPLEAGPGYFFAALSRDGDAALWGGPDFIRIWPKQGGRQTEGYRVANVSRVTAFAFHPTTRSFTICDGRRARVFDTDSRAERQGTEADGACRSLAFDDRGARLAIGSGGGVVQIFDVGTWTRQTALEAPEAIGNIAFSHSGTHVAALTGERVRVWEIASQREVARIPIPIHELSRGLSEAGRLSFSPDDRFVHLGGGRSFWRTADLVSEACRRLTRNLSREEVGALLPFGYAYTPGCTIEPRAAAK